MCLQHLLHFRRNELFREKQKQILLHRDEHHPERHRKRREEFSSQTRVLPTFRRRRFRRRGRIFNAAASHRAPRCCPRRRDHLLQCSLFCVHNKEVFLSEKRRGEKKRVKFFVSRDVFAKNAPKITRQKNSQTS